MGLLAEHDLSLVRADLLAYLDSDVEADARVGAELLVAHDLSNSWPNLTRRLRALPALHFECWVQAMKYASTYRTFRRTGLGEIVQRLTLMFPRRRTPSYGTEAE